MQVAQKTLQPGESISFNGRNDGSSITVTFVRGQALPDSCPQGQKGMVGSVQPVSDYIVKVVPPIGMTAASVQTPAPVVSTPLSPSAPPAPTQKSASLPIIVIGALGIGTLLITARRI